MKEIGRVDFLFSPTEVIVTLKEGEKLPLGASVFADAPVPAHATEEEIAAVMELVPVWLQSKTGTYEQIKHMLDVAAQARKPK